MRPTADACPLDACLSMALTRPPWASQTRCPAAQSVEGKRGAGEKRWVAGLDLERTSRNDISMVSKGTLSTLGAAVGGVVAVNGRSCPSAGRRPGHAVRNRGDMQNRLGGGGGGGGGHGSLSVTCRWWGNTRRLAINALVQISSGRGRPPTVSATSPEIGAPVDPPRRKGPQRGTVARLHGYGCVALDWRPAARRRARRRSVDNWGRERRVGCNTTCTLLGRSLTASQLLYSPVQSPPRSGKSREKSSYWHATCDLGAWLRSTSRWRS